MNYKLKWGFGGLPPIIMFICIDCVVYNQLCSGHTCQKGVNNKCHLHLNRMTMTNDCLTSRCLYYNSDELSNANVIVINAWMYFLIVSMWIRNKVGIHIYINIRYCHSYYHVCKACYNLTLIYYLRPSINCVCQCNKCYNSLTWNLHPGTYIRGHLGRSSLPTSSIGVYHPPQYSV